MIQDIMPHLYDVHFTTNTPQPDDMVLCCCDGQILRAENDAEAMYPTLAQLNFRPEQVRFLFTVDGKSLFLSMEHSMPQVEGFQAFRFNDFRQAKPRHLAFAGVTAAHLWRWYERHRFCGACGAEMAPSGTERAMVCPNCGQIYYPQISPAVIVAVTDGDHILLSRYAGREYRNYALLAGYCEIGETVEDTIHREVMEEVGLEVTNIRYYKSQPWGFSDTLLMGFFVDVKGSRDIHLDEEELSEGKWLHRSELDFPLDDVSLTQEMMALFRDGKEPK